MQLKTSTIVETEVEITTPSAALEWDTVWLLERWQAMHLIRRAEEVIAEMVLSGRSTLSLPSLHRSRGGSRGRLRSATA